ncbi:flagellar hook-basal body complex protein FliE [Garciella nitratireducens]|uniref:Flagellar hook-basal body complex protein FliE n=1 Tax=Garciella nitratireducens DSM 15102 TaxID=1121911 RepID=A0A1T4LEJ4_9FIRM|nr:flagellar hook-basal body complex protein FliE [Garciella nitratireducens]RBP46768.1 flagellar hook-basal body complex protein FliE [Garciella nitratireducens]SJZ52978.1 flagellar hook-basal body complex protein FliE [Garciella nitratireducens DSM 15102]
MKINPATQAYISHIQGINPVYTKEDADFNSSKKIDFSTLFQKKLQEINGLQLQADRANQELVTGEAEDLYSVLLTTEEARLALEIAMQVRNKMIDSYKEINSIQL